MGNPNTSQRIGRYLLYLALRSGVPRAAPRVVICDPHPAIADSLGQTLRLEGCEVVGVTTDPEETFALCVRHHATVVVSEINLPVNGDRDGPRALSKGLELIESLQVLRPPPKLIARTSLLTRVAREAVLAAGARIVVGLDIGTRLLLMEVLDAHRAYLTGGPWRRELVMGAGVGALVTVQTVVEGPLPALLW